MKRWLRLGPRDGLGHFTCPKGRDEPFRARVFAKPALQRTDPTQPPTSDLPLEISTRAVVGSRALKGRLGHFARPEGRDDPFRARVLAETPLQRMGALTSATVASTRTPAVRAIPIAFSITSNDSVVSA